MTSRCSHFAAGGLSNKKVFHDLPHTPSGFFCRITCSDVTANGKKMQVIATYGNGSMQENIVDVFGPKQMLHLEEIRWDLEKPLSEEALDHFNIRIKPEGQ